MWEWEVFLFFIIRDMLGSQVCEVLKKYSKIWLCEITLLLYISYSCSVLNF